MGVFIYKIKDRRTGEVLFTGRESAAAEYLGCAAKHVQQLADRKGQHKNTAYGGFEISRQWEEKPVLCVDCGAEIPGAGPKRERCDSCRQKRKKAMESEYHRKIKQLSGENLVEYAISKQELQKDCVGCIYFGGEHYINSTCNYIFMEGHSRGDRYGEKCTKRKERKRK